MSAAGPYLRRHSTGYAFWCPGCKIVHNVSDSWSFNGNMERPTFSPSVLVTSGCQNARHQPGEECWCTWNAEHPDSPSNFHCIRCHSFIREGRIEFLSDCNHPLAGQTVPMAPFPASDPEAQ